MIFFRKKKLLPPSPLLISSKIKVSFCITHQNREDYLKKTLAENLRDCQDQRGFTEFVLTDFNHNTNVKAWVLSDLKDYLADGYLKYYHSDLLDTWHASIAKNVSHSLAEGAILVNLDCDNFTGPDGSQFIYDAFQERPNNLILWQFSGKKQDGSFGRISLTKDMFHQLGGYDESFLPMGYQDDDLLARAERMGLIKVRAKDARFNRCIRNEKYQPESMSYTEMKMSNKKRSRTNLKTGQLTANGGLPVRSGIKKLNTKGQMVPVNPSS